MCNLKNISKGKVGMFPEKCHNLLRNYFSDNFLFQVIIPNVHDIEEFSWRKVPNVDPNHFSSDRNANEQTKPHQHKLPPNIQCSVYASEFRNFQSLLAFMPHILFQMSTISISSLLKIPPHLLCSLCLKLYNW